MAKILYISLTGMTEALGESQVIQYLLELSKNNSIYLFSFEKSSDKSQYKIMQEKLEKSNIAWKYSEYSNRYGILSSAWQIILAFFLLIKCVKEKDIQIVHTRSLIPAVIGYLLKKFFNTKLLFDIRGFAIDEKIMDGRLKEKSMVTNFLRNLEYKIYKESDHLVTLTHVSKNILIDKYRINHNVISVIPTCANSKLFYSISHEEKIIQKEKLGFLSDDIIILHSGSLNNWVDFDAEIKLFKELQFNKNFKFLILNNGQHDLIISYLDKYKINKNQYKLLSINFNQVNSYLNIADLCVFFIKPSFAKQASAPTKFAEVVACNLYSITNTSYGDMEYYFNSYKVGKLFDLQKIHANPKVIARDVIEYISIISGNKSNNKLDFDLLFSQNFSIDIAIERYRNIYDHLTKESYESTVVS